MQITAFLSEPISGITEEHINYILEESNSDDDVQDVEAFDPDFEPFFDRSDESENEDAEVRNTPAPTLPSLQVPHTSTSPFPTQTALHSEEMINAEASHSEGFEWTKTRPEVSKFPFLPNSGMIC